MVANSVQRHELSFNAARTVLSEFRSRLIEGGAECTPKRRGGSRWYKR
jgi:hypothetical protein